jgi:hypothetical protein
MHSSATYHTILPDAPVASDGVAERVFAQTFRTDFSAPGFSLLSFATPIASQELRAYMVALKQELDALVHARTGKRLVYQSMARFNQQVTTKFHLDGAPAEAFLMLGYEPSEVACNLAMADYSLAAWNLGITPAEFIRDHNPMYASGARLLEGTITPLASFDPSGSNILVINNSCLPFDAKNKNLLGVMHQATIPHPDLAKNRIINSTMLRTAASLDEEAVTVAQQQDYVSTSAISGPSAY